MAPTFSYLAEQFGPVAAIAVVLNIILVVSMIGLGKAFAKHLLTEIRAIRQLLDDETKIIRERLTNHAERIARLEGRDERQ